MTGSAILLCRDDDYVPYCDSSLDYAAWMIQEIKMGNRPNPKVYTRQGDLGQTRLMYNSEQVPKYHVRVVALADFEVLYSAIAEALQYEHRTSLALTLKRMRKLGGEIGTHPTNLKQFYKSERYAAIDASDVAEVEDWIDEMMETTNIYHGFVWAETPEAAKIDTARALARRLETSLVPLFLGKRLSHQAMQYVNRLSDFLFVLARYVEQGHQRAWAEMIQKDKPL